jgi:hypothetical protein
VDRKKSLFQQWVLPSGGSLLLLARRSMHVVSQGTLHPPFDLSKSEMICTPINICMTQFCK